MVERAANAGPRVYVGPSIPKTALRQNTVFSEDLPPFMGPILEVYPEVARLLVPVTEMAQAQAEVLDGTTFKSRMAHVIREKIAKGGA